MPLFTARPVTVEAHQYKGNTLNMEGAFNAAFSSYQSGGRATIRTVDGLFALDPGDWLVRGSDGVIRVVRKAAFEDSYAPINQAPSAPEDEVLLCQTIRRGPGRPPKSASVS